MAVYHDMSFEEYLNIDALNSSSLKDFRKSPVIYKWNNDHPKGKSDSMFFGDVVHKWVLERPAFGYDFYVASEEETQALNSYREMVSDIDGVVTKERIAVYPESLGKARRGQKFEQFVLDNPHKIIILEKEEEMFFKMMEFNTIVGPREIVPETMYNDIKTDLEDVSIEGMNEFTVVFEYRGLKMKARFDSIVGDTNGVFDVWDVKTTKAPHKFEREIVNWEYFIQFGFYSIAAREVFGRLPRYFKFLAIPNFRPYNDFTTHRVNKEYLDYSIALVEELIEEFIERKKRGDWSRRNVENEVFKPGYL